MKWTFVRAIIEGGSALIGKVRLVGSGGEELTEDGAIKAKLLDGGKVQMVDAEGEPLAELGSKLQDGENYVGRVGSTLKWILHRKLLAAAGDYAAEDILSENATVGSAWIFDGVGRLPGKGGYITKAMAVLGITALTPRLTFYLFEALPTSTFADNAANVAPNLADLPIYIGRIDFPALEDLGGMSGAVATPSTGGNLPLHFIAPENRLYGVLVTRDAIAGEAVNMVAHIGLGVEQA